MSVEHNNAFLSIARTRIINFAEGRVCQDQYVGEITISDEHISTLQSNVDGSDFITRVSTFEYNRPARPCVLFILESPHISEFKGSFPRPAAGNGYGDTGNAIRNLFSEVIFLNKFIPIGKYPLIIINAIQFQCSLGDIKKHRDIIFRKCWEAFAKEDFRIRFSKIYENGDIIINACTAGGKKKVAEIKIRELVKTEIESIGVTAFEVQHPASWMRIHNEANKQSLIPDYSWKT